jgi:serine protease Do
MAYGSLVPLSRTSFFACGQARVFMTDHNGNCGARRLFGNRSARGRLFRRCLLWTCLVLGLGGTVTAAPLVAAVEPPIVHSERLDELNKPAPADSADLRAIEAQVTKIVDHVRQSTVGIIVGESQGSGVIVSENGLVLTAGHVISIPGRKATVVLSDGRKVAGRALGVNSASDCGMVQITDRGPFPASKISDLETLKVGDWCVGTGHPGGYQAGRPPVVRLGRLVANHSTLLQSDCPLLGGDSGGPLFDLNGNIIGIHSRIGPRTSLNLHVSAALFIRDWDRLTKSPDLEHVSTASQGMLGVNGVDDPQGGRITDVFPRLPAEEAGVKAGDVVTRFSGLPVHAFSDLTKHVKARRPGEIVELRVIRDGKVLDFRATLVARPSE